MYPLRNLLGILICVFFVNACMTHRTFIDPTYPVISYDDIEKRSPPLNLSLSTQFLQNDKPAPHADAFVRESLENALSTSGVIDPTNDGSDGEIQIIINDKFDKSGLAAKQYAVIWTSGLAGFKSKDNYEMSTIITVGSKIFSSSGIKHSLYSMKGITSKPPDNIEVGGMVESGV